MNDTSNSHLVNSYPKVLKQSEFRYLYIYSLLFRNVIRHLPVPAFEPLKSPFSLFGGTGVVRNTKNTAVRESVMI